MSEIEYQLLKQEFQGLHRSPEQQKLIKLELQYRIQNMLTDTSTVDLAQKVNKYVKFYPHIVMVNAIIFYRKYQAPLAVSVFVRHFFSLFLCISSDLTPDPLWSHFALEKHAWFDLTLICTSFAFTLVSAL